jgi:MerR family transcriptional regulator, light-induced transcriptional regulator
VSSEGLTIREVARRTGVESATLRMWEQRYEFPEPQRLPSGHRRYSNLDVELIGQVIRDREGGLGLKAAIEQAKRAVRGERPVIEDDSIFSGLRRRRSDLHPQLLPKSTLVSMSHAIEDECAARSSKAMLFGSFQRERFYRQAEPRWRDLAPASECAFVLADFGEVRAPEGGPVEVPIDSTEPVGREWSVVYDAPNFGAVLSGWERPGQDETPDQARTFETLWSVEPELVRDASTVAYGIVERNHPELVRGLESLLGRPVDPSRPWISELTGLTNRMVAYVSASATPRPAPRSS